MVYNIIFKCLLSVAVAAFPAMTQAQNTTTERAKAMKAALDDYVQTHDAKIGIAVITDRHDTVCVNNGYQYPMNSVMKLYQAMAVADEMQRRRHSLDSVITVGRDEMKEDTYSPMRDKYPTGDIHISIGDLLKYSLQQSDNNACDILFSHITGVGATDGYIRSLGFDGFAIAANEAEMHADTARVRDNRNNPLTAAMLINRLFTENIYTDEYQRFITETLDGCTTGENRLAKPLLPAKATIGHKTGTGFTSADGHPQGINDVGFVRLPNGRHYSVAVFVESSQYDMEETERMISEISEIVFRHI